MIGAAFIEILAAIAMMAEADLVTRSMDVEITSCQQRYTFRDPYILHGDPVPLCKEMMR
jgi:hypothetical protein